MQGSAARAKSTWFRRVEDMSKHKRQGAAWASGPLVLCCFRKASGKLLESLREFLEIFPEIFQRSHGTYSFSVFHTAHFYELVFSFSFISFRKMSRNFPGASRAAVISTLRVFFLFGKVSWKPSSNAVKVNVLTPDRKSVCFWFRRWGGCWRLPLFLALGWLLVAVSGFGAGVAVGDCFWFWRQFVFKLSP